MNVANPNDAIREEIVRLTRGFRERTERYPEALYAFLDSKGVDVMRSVLVSVSTAEQGTNPICGVVLTQDGRFMNFDLDCSANGHVIVDIHAWTDDTEAHNRSAHNPGFGKGRGRIAVELLQELDNAG